MSCVGALTVLTGRLAGGEKTHLRRLVAVATRGAAYRMPMTARDEVPAAARALAAHSSDGNFTVEEVLDHLRRHESTYRPSTIRTHVTSRMCANAPDHHAFTYRDLVRVQEGTYKLNPDV